MSEKLFFHLRGYRKRANLTQHELAWLLGFAQETNVSRYETRKRGHGLESALRLQAIFRTPVADLFSDHYTKVELQVINRARELHEAIDCEGCSNCRDCLKGVFLRDLIARKQPRAPASIWNKEKTMPPSLP